MGNIPEDIWNEIWKIRPTVAADTVAIKDNKVLLIKRATEPFKGKWCLPGGVMDVGETIEETAVREVREETGYDVKLVSLTGVYSGPDRDPRGTTAAVAHLADVLDKTGTPDSEVSDVKFFPVNDIPDLGFDHNRIIEDALKILHSNDRHGK